MSQNACVSFPNSEQHTTFKESMINWLSNLINRNRSAAKISQVLCSSKNAKFWLIKVTLFWSQVCDVHFLCHEQFIPESHSADSSNILATLCGTCNHFSCCSPLLPPSLPRDSCNHFSSKCIWAPPLVAGSCLPDPCDHFSKCKSAPWWSSGGGQLTTCCLSARMIIHQAASTNA